MALRSVPFMVSVLVSIRLNSWVIDSQKALKSLWPEALANPPTRRALVAQADVVVGDALDE